MSQHDLTKALQDLVLRHGVSSVLHSLADIQSSSEKFSLPSPSRREHVRHMKGKISAVDYVGKMTLPSDKIEIMMRAARQFEDKKFLPSIPNIREFCRIHNIELSKSPSRANSIPLVFKFLVAMDAIRIEKILDNGAFSGPASLAPIADAIRNRSSKRPPDHYPDFSQPLFDDTVTNRTKNR